MRHPLLREENILVGLEAKSCEEALEKIVDFLPEWVLTADEKRKIFQSLLLREQVGTTAIGRGVAFPHCFSDEVHEPVIAFGVSAGGVSYPSLDGRAVHFIFILVLPRTEAAEQQKRLILQNIKWLLFDRYLQERLRMARTASEVYQLLVPDAQRQLALGV